MTLFMLHVLGGLRKSYLGACQIGVSMLPVWGHFGEQMELVNSDCSALFPVVCIWNLAPAVGFLGPGKHYQIRLGVSKNCPIGIGVWIEYLGIALLIFVSLNHWSRSCFALIAHSKRRPRSQRSQRIWGRQMRWQLEDNWSRNVQLDESLQNEQIKRFSGQLSWFRIMPLLPYHIL